MLFTLAKSKLFHNEAEILCDMILFQCHVGPSIK